MRWSIRKSNDLKMKIAKNEKLMKELSSSVDNVFKNHKFDLKSLGLSYVFEPRVFTMRANEAPEVMIRSRQAMARAIMESTFGREPVTGNELTIYLPKCLPLCGPMDRITLDNLERFRVIDVHQVVSDGNPLPPVKNIEVFIQRIVANKDLLGQLSTNIFTTIETHGITFKENEGCVFTPMVFETPIFAQKVGKAKSLAQVQGFGPQVYDDPTPEPAFPVSRFKIKFSPLPGIIAFPGWRTPGVIIPPWWWIGIPAPEMLKALDIMRNIEKTT